MRLGGLCKIPLKGVKQKREGWKQNIKKGGKAGAKGRCLKKKGGWHPLANYECMYVCMHECMIYVNSFSHDLFQRFF